MRRFSVVNIWVTKLGNKEVAEIIFSVNRIKAVLAKHFGFLVKI